MFAGVKPFDWIMLGVEVAVLALILYSEIVHGLRHRKEVEHQKMLAKKVTLLDELMQKGIKLRFETPRVLHGQPGNPINEWMNLVAEWEQQTESLLAEHSAKAASAFSITEAPDIDRATVRMPNKTGFVFVILYHHALSYLMLTAKLNVLREIMEKPDAYF